MKALFKRFGGGAALFFLLFENLEDSSLTSVNIASTVSAVHTSDGIALLIASSDNSALVDIGDNDA